jgi:DNA-binding NtrC family response regulator
MKRLVLLVDDEEIIRLTSGEILEELGFDVVAAATGREGLAVFRERNSEISLVFIDMTLPDMSGMDLFEEMKKISQDTKFLLTSGYRQDMTGAGDKAVFIQKPYTISELNIRLTELLG